MKPLRISAAIAVGVGAFVGAPSAARADIQCYGTVQSAIVDTTTGIVTLTIVPTPPATTVCPSPCNPDPGTGWTFVSLAASNSSKNLVFGAGLAAAVAGKPVYLAVNPTPLPGNGNCQLDVLQVKSG